MNLWNLFPVTELLNIPGVLYLPRFAIPAYILTIVVAVKLPQQRIRLAAFWILTLLVSISVLISFSQRIDLIIPPLLLTSVMLMPLWILATEIWKRSSSGIWTWAIATAAGWLHSLSWAAWLMAIMGSWVRHDFTVSWQAEKLITPP